VFERLYRVHLNRNATFSPVNRKTISFGKIFSLGVKNKTKTKQKTTKPSFPG
jgi:hypothetical protein